MRKATSLIALFALSTPELASAQILAQAAGIFNIFAGLMLVAAFLIFFGALGGWFARRGVWPGYRDEMIHLMTWGVAVLFVLLIILAAIDFVQNHQAAAAFIAGLAIFFFVVWIAFKVAADSSRGEKEGH